MTEPRRLLDSEDLPASLREALSALERQAPDANAVLRVQRSLEALPPSSGGRGTFGPTALRMIASLVAIGLSVLFVVRASKQVVLPPTQSVPEQPAPATSRPEPAPPTAAAEPAPAAVLPLASISEPRVLPKHARSGPRTRRAAAESGNVGAAASPNVAVAVQTRELPAAAPSTSAHATVPDTNSERLVSVGAAAAAEPPRQVSQPPAAEPTDEAGLLFRAKRLAARNPSAALRLLESHAFYFPNGSFVQERDVLAIQLHQQLGHDAQARLLAKRFRARFPNSVYRNSIAP